MSVRGACSIDAVTGEVRLARLTPDFGEQWGWLEGLDRPVSMAYEAGRTGFGLAVEIGNWHRFTGSSIGAFVGLTPTESSSGASRSLGSITKVGNTHTHRWLHARWQRLDARGKRVTVANVDIARELAGWCWSLAVMT